MSTTRTELPARYRRCASSRSTHRLDGLQAKPFADLNVPIEHRFGQPVLDWLEDPPPGFARLPQELGPRSGPLGETVSPVWRADRRWRTQPGSCPDSLRGLGIRKTSSAPEREMVKNLLSRDRRAPWRGSGRRRCRRADRVPLRPGSGRGIRTVMSPSRWRLEDPGSRAIRICLHPRRASRQVVVVFINLASSLASSHFSNSLAGTYGPRRLRERPRPSPPQKR